ncbi:MAG: DUF4159 domain-containing protein [Deltaproteobacteria bacterium]|nr:DUF4159 domain-containing protein [Deltaproteobacteria bacterium]
MRDSRVQRRTFLLAPLLLGAKSPSDLSVAQLRVSSAPSPRAEAMTRLLWEAGQRTSIEASLEVVEVRPTEPKLFRTPFLYLSGSGAFPELSSDSVRWLRRYLVYGGTLLVDDADADPGGAFDDSVRRELSRLLPGHALERLSSDHVVYKTYYLVDSQAGRVLRVPYLEGITIEKRLTVIYSMNDLGGAWARDAFGRWEFPVTPGGERQREMAFRLGVNILMYALCLDYKEDLVHAPFILKRRR